ncbi:hypothetical protein CSKR_106745 [Clonorchis sinensis]|uniref:Uncharacterized protein n=1 Tax=Clonorchis sinensis TaxID=79923 RepID=A0A3R7FMT6_CLOSI|nr:hypothetical protein CSKR_106745 [Clonorchis sinensis]
MDQPGMRDSVSVTRAPPSVAQWVAEVHKPPHHGKVQSLRGGCKALVNATLNLAESGLLLSNACVLDSLLSQYESKHIRQALTEDFTPIFGQCEREVIRTKSSAALERKFAVINLRQRSGFQDHRPEFHFSCRFQRTGSGCPPELLLEVFVPAAEASFFNQDYLQVVSGDPSHGPAFPAFYASSVSLAFEVHQASCFNLRLIIRRAKLCSGPAGTSPRDSSSSV